MRRAFGQRVTDPKTTLCRVCLDNLQKSPKLVGLRYFLEFVDLAGAERGGSASDFDLER
jgi:hypothetical protein